MSYRCQICNDKVAHKSAAIRLILDKRIKYYPYRPKANPGYQTKNGQLLQPLRKSRRQSDRTDDPGGRGWEMAKEIYVCQSCSDKLNKDSLQEKDDATGTS